MRIRSLAAATLLLFVSGLSFSQVPAQQYANFETCPLQNGQVIRDCRIGYLTYGTLNADRSNVVVVTSWFTGTAEQAGEAYFGAAIDSAKYFVVAIDALGDGVSSSPSNSALQPRMKFPEFSTRDMVETQHRVLVETLHLSHVHAVLGGSMGGMQALQWAYAYPDFMDRIVAIVPTPRLTAYDLLLWRSELNAIESDVEWRGGEYTGRPMIKAAIDLHNLHLQTPSKINHDVSAADFQRVVGHIETDYRFDPNNQVRQLQAMLSHDVAPGKSMAEMAKMLKPQTLIVVAQQDMMVNPIPATELAKAAHTGLVELTSDCGHLAPGCESDKVKAAVREFLAK